MKSSLTMETSLFMIAFFLRMFLEAMVKNSIAITNTAPFGQFSFLDTLLTFKLNTSLVTRVCDGQKNVLYANFTPDSVSSSSQNVWSSSRQFLAPQHLNYH